MGAAAAIAARFHRPFPLELAVTAVSFTSGALTGAVVVLVTLGAKVLGGHTHTADVALIPAHVAAAFAGLRLLRRPSDTTPHSSWGTVRIAWLLTLAFAAGLGERLISTHSLPGLGRWTFTALGIAGALLLAAIVVWRPSRSTGSMSTFGTASIALVTVATLLFTTLFWTNSDEHLLHVTADATVVGLLGSLSDEVNVIAAKSATSTATPFDADRFPSLVETLVYGHEPLHAVQLVRVEADRSINVLSGMSNLGKEFETAMSAWATDHSALIADAMASGGPTYLDVVSLPMPMGGSQPHLMYATPIAERGTYADSRVLMLTAMSLPTLVQSASAPTLAATGQATIAVYLQTPRGARALWSTGTTKAIAPAETNEPVDTIARRALVTFTLGDAEFDLSVERGVDFGSPLGFRRIVLAAELLLGLLLFGIVFARCRQNEARERDRERREALLSAALEGAPGWTAIVDQDDVVVMANHGPHGVGAGVSVTDVELWAGDAEARGRVLQLLAAARAGVAGTMQHVWTDHADPHAAMRIFELDARPLPDSTLVHVQCLDVTELRDRAMRTAQSERMEAVGVLAGGLAHDFNNLLFITLGYLQMLQRQPLITADRQASTFVGRAIEAVDRGAVVARSLLSFARSQPLTAVPLNLREFLDGVAPLIEQGLGSAHSLTIATDPAAALDVVADPGRLSSSLLNIVFNARDAMDAPGSLRLTVRRRSAAPTPDAAEQDMIEIALHDTGKGIPADVLPRVFEPFFTTKKVGSGTGLGLATVYSFAQQSGGWATIESTEGHGTTVSILLPPALGTEQPSGKEPGVPQRATRALVVDDEPALADLVGGWLESFGMHVKVAHTPQVALQLADEFQPHLLVSDASLEDPIDGLELARILVQRDPSLLVVFMTGFSDRIKALQRAGVTTLAKPFSSDDLHAALATHLGERLAAHPSGAAR